MQNYIKWSYSVLILLLFAMSCSPFKSNEEVPEVDDNILIRGAFFSGANGVYFDKNDRLHVASVVSRLIGVVNTETGAIEETFTHETGVEGPDDLTFGPDGSMYFTSILTGEVGRRMSDGTVTKQLVAGGTNPITFSDDGRLFVALDFQGDGLYELDPELIEPPRLIIKELGWLNGMDFGPDGYLYGPIWSKGHIVKIDVDNGSLEVIVDDLDTPAAVKFDSKGNLHAVDHGTGIVYKIDIANGSKSEIARGFVGADNIAFNSKDELYLAHAQDGSIHQINMDGTTREVIAPALCNAADVEVIGNELVIPDILSLKKFSTTTGKRTKIYNHMIGRPGVIGPFTIDHDGGEIVMTSWFGNEVQIWDINKDEEVKNYHDYPVPVNAVLDNKSLYVAELGLTPGAAKVTRQRRDEERETLLDASAGLIVPAGLAAKLGNIYVSDYYTGNIFQIRSNNEAFEKPEVILSALKQPEGLQIGPNGNLLIVETGMDRVLSYNFESKDLKTVVDSIPLGQTGPQGMPPTWKISDVHFKGNTLYVPSDIDNVVYEFKGVL